MTDAVLVINAGSATVKFSAYSVDASTAEAVPRYTGKAEQVSTLQGQKGQLQVVDSAGQTVAQCDVKAADEHTVGPALLLQAVLDWLEAQAGALRWRAVGHRVVHGGERYAEPVLLNANVLDYLQHLVPLAPLHQPHNLAAIQALAALRPDLPQVACFDTAFHRTQAKTAQMYALPRRYWDEGVKAYGFHGLSYEYVASILPLQLGHQAARGRVIIAHLGNGASLCALHSGRSVASTMGFTALEGLVMGTRCGAIDPGVVLYLMAEKKMDANAVSELLYRQSGLLGVSGLSGDMRDLLNSDTPEANEAIELFVHRIQRHLGSLVAALQGLDALVFTGGIGENAAPIRARVCRDLAWLGLELDTDANERGDKRISREDSRISAWVLPTDEEGVIARHTLALLA